jgi:transcriptional antiterminator RfaH
MTVGRANWYVVHTHAHAEAKAAFNIGRQGYSVFLPRYRKRRSHARKIDIVPAPLFPRYVFVAIDLAVQRWRAIESTFGVSHLVCHGDKPAIVPDQVIVGLKDRIDADGYVQLDRPVLVPGDKVRVRHGTFHNSLGLYEGMSDRERVTILLDMLGRMVRVVIDADAIEAA